MKKKILTKQKSSNGIKRNVIKSVLPKRKYVKQEVRFERLRNNLCQECGSKEQRAGTISFTCLDCGHVEMCL